MKRARNHRPHDFAHVSRRLATRADGAILLSTKDLGNRDLAGCEVETYVTLQAEQAALARRCLDEGVAEAGAKLVSTFPKKGKRQPWSWRRRSRRGSLPA